MGFSRTIAQILFTQHEDYAFVVVFFASCSWWLIWTSIIIQSVLIKRKPRQPCPFLLTLPSIWIILGILWEGYFLFPMVSVNEHFKNRLTIWLCTKMLSLRLVPSLWHLRTFSKQLIFLEPDVQEISGQTCFQPPATCSIPFSHSENSLLFCELWSVLVV